MWGKRKRKLVASMGIPTYVDAKEIYSKLSQQDKEIVDSLVKIRGTDEEIEIEMSGKSASDFFKLITIVEGLAGEKTN